MMDQWKKLLSVVALAYAVVCSPSFAQETPTKYDLVFTWADIEYASQFQLEEQDPTSQDPLSWTPVEGEMTGDFDPASEKDRLTRLISREEGTYKYRVIACITNPASPEPPECSANVANYSAEVTVEVGPAKRRVIFIHTDLLGSPAAETDETGI